MRDIATVTRWRSADFFDVAHPGGRRARVYSVQAGAGQPIFACGESDQTRRRQHLHGRLVSV